MKITSSLNDQLMACAAYRYCLGRRSYIVSSCIEWLEEHFDQFDENSSRVCIRDILEEVVDTKFGELAYKEEWLHLVYKLWLKLTLEKKKWVINALKHKIDIRKYLEENKKDHVGPLYPEILSEKYEMPDINVKN